MISRIITVCLLLAAGGVMCGNKPHAELGERLLSERAPLVFTLTPPGVENHGGTGFLARMPSGRTLMVTNRHVCDIAVGGFMAAHYPDNPARASNIKVLEASTVTDLCLLEGIPGIEGMPIATTFDAHKKVASVGHPRLQPATFTEGYVFARDIVKAMEPGEAKDCKQKVESIDTFFGPIAVCIEEVDAYRSTVVILPGSSGSPVFDEEANVVGVMFAGEEDTHWGSFVPLDALNAFINIY